MPVTPARVTGAARAKDTKSLLIRNVPAHTIKALKRAAVELDQPMGRVLAGLVSEFLGLHVILKREPDSLTPEEAAQLREVREEMAHGRSSDWQALKRELGIG